MDTDKRILRILHGAGGDHEGFHRNTKPIDFGLGNFHFSSIAGPENNVFMFLSQTSPHNVAITTYGLWSTFATFESNKTLDDEKATAFGCRLHGIIVYAPHDDSKHGKTKRGDRKSTRLTSSH